MHRERLYEEVADQIEELVGRGAFQPGDRLPSVRELCRQRRISPATAMEAYRLLEDRGLAEVRPQSGHYVRARYAGPAEEPPVTRTAAIPEEVSAGHWILRVLRDTRNPRLVPLGAAVPHPSNLPLDALSRAMARVARRDPLAGGRYDVPPGCEPLRAQLARRSLAMGCVLSPDEIVITGGCQEAIGLSLRAVCRPGDVVAVESPTYFNFLQVIEVLGLRALEVGTSPREGMELEALERALREQPVRACLLSTNFSNPLGSLMPEEKKRALVDLLARYEVPLIEDDLNGDLGFGADRPWAAKAYDRAGLVLLCSSFSKTLAPGYRVGWVAGGRYHEAISRLKAAENIACPTLPQLAIAEFLETGAYDRHLRRVRRTYARQVQQLSEAVGRHFPAGTRMTRPQGGFVLWVECPEGLDALKLYEACAAQGIGIAPGPIFSPRLDYGRCIRLHAAYWSAATEEAVAQVGRLVATMVGS